MRTRRQVTRPQLLRCPIRSLNPSHYRDDLTCKCEAAFDWPPKKEEASCCTAHRDDLGRLLPGFCSPTCLRRPAVWAARPGADENEEER